jgi:hypothetical protein
MGQGFVDRVGTEAEFPAGRQIPGLQKMAPRQLKRISVHGAGAYWHTFKNGSIDSKRVPNGMRMQEGNGKQVRVTCPWSLRLQRSHIFDKALSLKKLKFTVKRWNRKSRSATIPVRHWAEKSYS